MYSSNLASIVFFYHYHPKSNKRLEVFHKYLKPTLRKLCKDDQDNWDQYISQLLASNHVTPHLATAETHFFLIYGRDPNLPLHQLVEPIQSFLSNPESGQLNMEMHHLALAKTKITLDENRFKNALKRWIAFHLVFKLPKESTSKKQPGKWDMAWRAGYRVVHIKCDRHYLHMENQATGKTQACNVKDMVHEPLVELWNIDTHFGRAGKFINHPVVQTNSYICLIIRKHQHTKYSWNYK